MKKLPTKMGAENIIEKRDAIVDTVPDILLTNFKMLDYGLSAAAVYTTLEGKY